MRALHRRRRRLSAAAPGGQSWFGLDLAVSVASGTPALSASRSTPPDPPRISPRMLCPASATVSPTCAATAASISPASICVVRLDTERDQLALDQTGNGPPGTTALDPRSASFSPTALQTSLPLALSRAIPPYHLAPRTHGALQPQSRPVPARSSDLMPPTPPASSCGAPRPSVLPTTGSAAGCPSSSAPVRSCCMRSARRQCPSPRDRRQRDATVSSPLPLASASHALRSRRGPNCRRLDASVANSLLQPACAAASNRWHLIRMHLVLGCIGLRIVRLRGSASTERHTPRGFATNCAVNRRRVIAIPVGPPHGLEYTLSCSRFSGTSCDLTRRLWEGFK